MALPPVYNPLVCKLVARGYCEGQEILNTSHWLAPAGGPWDSVKQNDLAFNYYSWWNQRVQPLCVAGYVMSEIVVTQLAVNGFQTIWTAGLPVSGSAAGDGLPLNVAACVTFGTGRAGRAGRGRYYLGCLAEAVTIGSRFIPTFVAAMNVAFGDMPTLVSSVGSAVHQLVVYSTVLNNVRRATGLATPVTSCYLRDNVVDSQRRRLPGRGR